jgi:hypothetical protein
MRRNMNKCKFEKLMTGLSLVRSRAKLKGRKMAPKYFEGNQSINHLSIEQAVEIVQLFPEIYVWLPNHLKKPEVELASKLW